MEKFQELLKISKEILESIPYCENSTYCSKHEEAKLSEKHKALNYFIRNKNYDSLSHLLEDPEIDIYTPNEAGDTPFHLAVLYQDMKILEMLFLKKEDLENAELLLAVEKNFQKVAQNLIEEFECKNVFKTKNLHGDTPLHLAVLNRNQEIVKFLIKKEREYNFLNNKNENGDTVLHLAVKTKDKNMIDLILNYVTVSLNCNGNTAYRLAVNLGKTQLINFFHEEYKNNIFSEKNKNNETVIDLAKKLNELEILSILNEFNRMYGKNFLMK